MFWITTTTHANIEVPLDEDIKMLFGTKTEVRVDGDDPYKKYQFIQDTIEGASVNAPGFDWLRLEWPTESLHRVHSGGCEFRSEVRIMSVRIRLAHIVSTTYAGPPPRDPTKENP